MKIIHEITLDLSRHGVQCAIPVAQHEVGMRRLIIRLRNGSEPIVLEAGDSAVLYLDTDLFDPVTVYTENGAYPNCLVYDISARATSVAGEHTAVLQFFRGSEQLAYSPEFAFAIRKDLTAGSAVLSSPQYAAILEIRDEMENQSVIVQENVQKALYWAKEAQNAAQGSLGVVDGALIVKCDEGMLNNGGVFVIEVSFALHDCMMSVTISNEDDQIVWGKEWHESDGLQQGEAYTGKAEVALAPGKYSISTYMCQVVSICKKVLEIRQSTGVSESSVMAQKATTEELNKRAGALVGNVSGEIVSMDDVSPFEQTIPVKLKSKNLFDVSKEEKGKWLLIGTGEVGGYSIFNTSDYIAIPPNTTFTVNYMRHCAFYDADKKYVGDSGNTTSTTQRTLTMPSNAYYMRFSYQHEKADGSVVQVELNTTSTAVTPYIKDDTKVSVSSLGKNLLHCPENTTVTYGGVTFTSKYGKVIVSGTAERDVQFLIVGNSENYILPVGTYTVSGSPTISNETCFMQTNLDRVYGGKKLTFDSDGEKNFFINISVKAGATIDNMVFEPQLEIGSTATKFEPYKDGETITTTLAKGAELTSIAPNMTIFTDKEGVIIECYYNKDSNIVIEKLTQAIISLGGNI